MLQQWIRKSEGIGEVTGKINHSIILSATKFLIVIGSQRAYLSHDQCAIIWVSNYRYPISTFCHWISVIGYPHDLHINYTHFLQLHCFLHFSKLMESATDTFTEKKFSKDIPKFVTDIINSWTSCHTMSYNSGCNCAGNFKSEITCAIPPWIVFQPSPIITIW